MINYRLSILSILLLLSICKIKAQTKLDLIPTQIVKDTYYGKVYEDPYHFMENINDTVVANWLHEQSNNATRTISMIINWEAIYNKQRESRGERPKVKYLRVTENNYHFYLKKEPDEKMYKLFFRKKFSSNEELLYNPENYKKSSGISYIINYIQPNWDGSKVAIGFTKNDEEFSELVVLDVKTKKLLPEVITNCWPSDLGGISWLRDNSGFYYIHIPVIDKNSEDYILNTATVLHKLDDEPKNLNVIFSAKNNPEINIEPADFPVVYSKPWYDNVLIGGIGGANSFWDYYYSRLDAKGKVIQWQPLFKKEDMVAQFDFNGKDFFFLSAKNSPNYKLCKTNIDYPDFKNPEILVVEDSNAVITDLAVTKNGIYYVKTKNGVDAQLYCLKEGKEQKIIIPKQSGFVDVSSKSPNSEDLWIEIEGWTSRTARYRYDYNKNVFVAEDLYPYPMFPELDDVVVEEIEVDSYDGAKVPLSIIYKKGTNLDGNNRVFMTGYGAFGISDTPYLYAHLLHWIREGGIYVDAHVRGGGEKGDAWHKGGFKSSKPNTWKDFIACTEYLIKKGYTNPDKIAVWSASGGGILIARAITERPDLYKAAIISSGAINMLRFEFGLNGKNTIKEFGTVNDSVEFHALLEMDACQHIKTGTKYPAVLLQAGANDPRVPVWHSSKFAAGLQTANVSGNPILFSVDFGGGHGFNLTTDKNDRNIADVISFALWQTGHPDFQLKK